MGQLQKIGRVFRALVPFRPSRSTDREDTGADTGGRQAAKIRIPVITTGNGRQNRPVLVPVRIRRNGRHR